MPTPLRLVLCLLSFLAGPLLLAEDKGPQTLEELRRAIEGVLKEKHVPGAAVAIVSRDKVEWATGVGLADEEANKPVTTNTIFRIGSVSKGFVALAAFPQTAEGWKYVVREAVVDDYIAQHLTPAP